MFLWRNNRNYPLSSNTLIYSTAMVKYEKFRPEKIAVVLPYGIASKRCRWNGKQRRPWVYAVYPDLSVWIVRTITVVKNLFEPRHEIMVLCVLHKLIFQMRMRSHPVELDVCFLVGPFVFFHTSCVRTVKLWRDCANAQARLSLRWSPMW